MSEFGAKVVGSWIGSDQYIHGQLAQKLETLTAEAEAIKQFPDSQSQNLMLRYCFCQKINYLQRLTPPPLMVNFVAQFDLLKREIFQQILRKPDISGPSVVLIYKMVVLDISFLQISLLSPLLPHCLKQKRVLRLFFLDSSITEQARWSMHFIIHSPIMVD